MKCYYEELGIARDANDADIKTAYRKLALRWHPDKNPNNLDESKEKFQTLQQAYEVLSDHHERAWYDNHREQILRGKNSEYEENCLDLFQYFTVSCFKGYNDDDKGFYKTYAEVFKKIAAEDVEFMDDEEEIDAIPMFGDSTSSYDDVVGPFYAYWQSYCTKKTYTWLCPHDITEIKDRRVLRYIEKDLKKIVQKAKRERNEEVRNLVSFIRKRDKRVQANKKLLEEKVALNRQKQEQNRLDQIRKRNREVEEMRKANANLSNEGYEEQLKQLEEEYGHELENDEESENSNSDAIDEEDHLDDLYCVACNRAFTNPNAFLNHETSKKHKENIERLKKEMQEEENSFKEEQEVIQIVELDDLDEFDDDFDDLSDDINVLPSDLEDIDDDLAAELADELNELELEEQEEELEEQLIEELNEEKVEELLIIPTKKSKSKKNKKAKKAPKVDLEEFEEDEKTEEKNLIESHIEIIDLEANENEKDKSDNEWGQNKKVSKKSKNKKTPKKPTPEAASVKLVEQEPAQESLSIHEVDPVSDTTHNCVTCKSTFPSKNKLFAHLKKTNHGVYIPKVKPEEGAKTHISKKSKGKRK